MKRCTKMYENEYKNTTETGIADLDTFLNLIADLDEKLELFAIGGTAMVLKNIKEATKDIDFLTTARYEKINELFNLAGLKETSNAKQPNIWNLEGIRIDIFYDEFILGVTLPDNWIEISEEVKTIGKLKLYILNWYDIIITKLARAEERDYQDILAIMKSQKVDFDILKERYFNLAEEAIIGQYKEKFKHLEELLNK